MCGQNLKRTSRKEREKGSSHLIIKTIQYKGKTIDVLYLTMRFYQPFHKVAEFTFKLMVFHFALAALMGGKTNGAIMI
jgi:hypothetical protein